MQAEKTVCLHLQQFKNHLRIDDMNKIGFMAIALTWQHEEAYESITEDNLDKCKKERIFMCEGGKQAWR